MSTTSLPCAGDAPSGTSRPLRGSQSEADITRLQSKKDLFLSGLPAAPRMLKVSREEGGVQISWEPPADSKTLHLTYSLWLTEYNGSSGDSKKSALVRVYAGYETEALLCDDCLKASCGNQQYKVGVAARSKKGHGPRAKLSWGGQGEKHSVNAGGDKETSTDQITVLATPAKAKPAREPDDPDAKTYRVDYFVKMSKVSGGFYLRWDIVKYPDLRVAGYSLGLLVQQDSPTLGKFNEQLTFKEFHRGPVQWAVVNENLMSRAHLENTGSVSYVFRICALSQRGNPGRTSVFKFPKGSESVDIVVPITIKIEEQSPKPPPSTFEIRAIQLVLKAKVPDRIISAPTVMVLHKYNGGIYLVWDKVENACEYAVWMLMRAGAVETDDTIPENKPFFYQVYDGPETWTFVEAERFIMNHIDCTNWPKLIFKIQAYDAHENCSPVHDFDWFQDMTPKFTKNMSLLKTVMYRNMFKKYKIPLPADLYISS